MSNVWTSWIKKQTDVLAVSAPLVRAGPQIFNTKQQHTLLKALSFSQSNKYVIVTIFRWLFPLLFLRLHKPSMSVSFIFPPSFPLSLFLWILSTSSRQMVRTCCLTFRPALPALLSQVENTPLRSTAPSWNNVTENLAGNICPYMDLEGKTNRCEKNGLTLDPFTWDSRLGLVLLPGCLVKLFFFLQIWSFQCATQKWQIVKHLDEAMTTVALDGSLTQCYWLGCSDYGVKVLGGVDWK